MVHTVNCMGSINSSVYAVRRRPCAKEVQMKLLYPKYVVALWQPNMDQQSAQKNHLKKINYSRGKRWLWRKRIWLWKRPSMMGILWLEVRDWLERDSAHSENRRERSAMVLAEHLLTRGARVTCFMEHRRSRPLIWGKGCHPTLLPRWLNGISLQAWWIKQTQPQAIEPKEWNMYTYP